MWKRKEVIGDCELYLGDCREVIPLLAPVDALITDPPYLIDAKGGGIAAKREYLGSISGHIDSGFDSAILSNFFNWLVFCNKKQIVELIQKAESQGLRWRLLTWNKTNPTPLSNGNYLPDTEYMIHAFRRHDYISKTGFIVGPVEKNDIPHPAVKPQYVMQKVISSASNIDERILDPFMGSGSTGIACLKMGRKFAGIEIEEKYFDIACKRIEQAYKQLDMFIVIKSNAAQQNVMGL